MSITETVITESLMPEQLRHDSEIRYFTRSRSMVSRVVAGETLIVPVRGKVGDLASIYSFNATGSLIWQLLDAPRSLRDLIAAVEHEYEVSEEQARKDVTHFLNEMFSVGLLDVGTGIPLDVERNIRACVSQ